MDGTIRSRRSAGADVVVVGRGPLAEAVVRRLAALSPVAAPPGAAVRTLPELPPQDPGSVLAGVWLVVLVADPADLAIDLGPPDRRRADAVANAQRTMTAAVEAGVEQVVVVTSAMVHGAEPDRPVIADDAPPITAAGAGLVGDLVSVEAVVARAVERAVRTRVVVLRPAALVGPGVDTLVTRHFAAPRLLAVRGADRPWQLVHVDDVAAAVQLAAEAGWTGSATVAADPVISADEIARVAGMRRIELPAIAAFATAERLHRVGVLPAPAEELAYVVYPWTVEPARLRAAGWRAQHDGHQCLDVLLAGVRGRMALGGRAMDGNLALGAAGAAVALLGTAAVLRQARARRYG